MGVESSITASGHAEDRLISPKYSARGAQVGHEIAAICPKPGLIFFNLGFGEHISPLKQGYAPA